MRYANDVASEIVRRELNALQSERLCADGFRVEQSIEAYDNQQFDLVTLFHVLEHLPKPVETLQAIRSRIKPNGRLIAEVPHARDFLHWTLSSEAFKNFTFWSEHLVLHTSDSLRGALQLRFSQRNCKGYQRYGLKIISIGW